MFLFQIESYEISTTNAWIFRNKWIVLPFVFDFQLHVFIIGLKFLCNLSSRNLRHFVDLAVVSKKENVSHLSFPDPPRVQVSGELKRARLPPEDGRCNFHLNGEAGHRVCQLPASQPIRQSNSSNSAMSSCGEVAPARRSAPASLSRLPPSRRSCAASPPSSGLSGSPSRPRTFITTRRPCAPGSSQAPELPCSAQGGTRMPPSRPECGTKESSAYFLSLRFYDGHWKMNWR